MLPAVDVCTKIDHENFNLAGLEKKVMSFLNLKTKKEIKIACVDQNKIKQNKNKRF